MSDTIFIPEITADPVPVSIPLQDVYPWAIFGLLMSALLIYFVGAEQGATALFNGMYVHEWVHDGRHLFGFPCH